MAPPILGQVVKRYSNAAEVTIELRPPFADDGFVRAKSRIMSRCGKAGLVCGVLFEIVLCNAQTVTIDTTVGGRRQTIDGFGTCLSGTEGEQSWWQELFINDLQASIVRMDLTPSFKSPYSDFTYNSPWFHNNPPLPGPETNNVRTYTNAASYQRQFAGRSAPIAVMGPDINQNTNYFNFSADGPRVAGTVAKLGASKAGRLGGFRLIASHWSPMPWVKISSGNSISGQSGILPVNGTPWPFIWGGNFAGGKLDTSGIARAEFDDSAFGGSGPTSALTQFVRCTAAYLRGFQTAYAVHFDAISIQNELNFEEFYNSCTYPLSSNYITALKAVRAELDKYPDLANIKLMGPEDLLGSDAYTLWQYGSGSTTIHKNLQYLQNIANDPLAAAAEAFFCIHGYGSDGVSAPAAVPTSWDWWANGWGASPAAGIPANVHGFMFFGKKSWMSETSGENPAWLSPATGFPNAGAWSLALRIHQSLTIGRQSAWVYWQMTDGNAVGAQTLTSSSLGTNSAKYVAAKHFFRFIRPGAVAANATVGGSTNLLASAFVHDTNQTLTLVLLNTSSNALTATINVPGAVEIDRFRTFTSSNSNYWQSSSVAVSNGVASVPVPGYGVVTLYGVKPAVLRAALEIPGSVSLSWTQAAAGFALQSAAVVGTTVNWQQETNEPIIDNNAANVTMAMTSNRFYRLVLP
jgi:O-glycosyl hydrolase